MGYVNFANLLSRLGMTPEANGPWAKVGDIGRVQGWKLHLTSVPVEAEDLLKTCVTIFRRENVAFKVARSLDILLQLNEGALGYTQIGKFVTVYPRSDAHARHIATDLVSVTAGFHGPEILTDLALGNVVYARYGSFHPITRYDRLGRDFPYIHDGSGTLVRDDYYIPFQLPAGVDHPFDGLVSGPLFQDTRIPAEQLDTKNVHVFGPGFVVLDVITVRPGASVFRALDLRAQEQVAVRVIKQGKPYHLQDEYGRDIRDRLRRQECLHRALSTAVPVPTAEAYFEVEGTGYLPLEFLEGSSLGSFRESFAAARFGEELLPERRNILRYFDGLIDAVIQLHSCGYVHRDLNPSNVWVGDQGTQSIYLLDLELAHEIGDDAPPFRLGTPGFMSPEQAGGARPEFTQDIYALGCLLIFLMTGLEPQHVLAGDAGRRRRVLRSLAPTAPAELVEATLQCVCEDPVTRLSLGQLRKVIRNCLVNSGALGRLPSAGIPHLAAHLIQPHAKEPLASCVSAGVVGLLEDVARDEATGMSLSLSSGQGRAWATPEALEIKRDAHAGVAGVIYLLSKLAQAGMGSAESARWVRAAVEWLDLGKAVASDRRLPGLYFGEAGVAVALSEAVRAGLVEKSEVEEFVKVALDGRIDWHDVTHGAAGQGIAAMSCSDLLTDTSLLDSSHSCAEYLMSTQETDGSWIAPPGVDGMSGETLTGFAHGVAGIVYFLAKYDQRFGDSRALHAWRKGADWLAGQSIEVAQGRALEWRLSDRSDERWTWWCHGSAGIALTFTALYEMTREQEYRAIATKALAGIPEEVRSANLSQCHGLSGLGEVYLEAGRVLAPYWLGKASGVATACADLRIDGPSGGATWLVESTATTTADLMIGSAGVVHFLARASGILAPSNPPLLLPPG